MNHAGEITPLTKLVRPHVAIVTTIAPVHLEYFGSLKKIADAKAEIFSGPRAGRRRRAQPRQPPICAARQGRRRRPASRASCRSAPMPRPTRGCCAIRCRPKSRPCRRASSARTSPTSSARPASIWCSIRWPCWRPPRWSGADLALAALALDNLKPASGRGTRITLRVPGGSALLIDESYNANPASMAAAIALLGQAAGRQARPPHRRAGRHAGTGRARARRCTAVSPSRSRRPASTWSIAAGR